MISIHIEGTAAEVRKQISELLGVDFIRVPMPAAEPAATGNTTAPQETTDTARSGKRPSGRTRAGATADRATEKEPAAISSGEQRVGPEDTPEVEAQDAADEKAEVSTAKLTHDDIRGALGVYVKKFGMPAALEDGPKVIKLALKNDALSKISEIPDTQEALIAVHTGIIEMTDKNPFSREVAK